MSVARPSRPAVARLGRHAPAALSQAQYAPPSSLAHSAAAPSCSLPIRPLSATYVSYLRLFRRLHKQASDKPRDRVDKQSTTHKIQHTEQHHIRHRHIQKSTNRRHRPSQHMPDANRQKQQRRRPDNQQRYINRYRRKQNRQLLRSRQPRKINIQHHQPTHTVKQTTSRLSNTFHDR